MKKIIRTVVVEETYYLKDGVTDYQEGDLIQCEVMYENTREEKFDGPF